MSYKSVPDGYSFESIFPTWIIAYCPDSDEWVATNHRFFYYEYPKEFKNEKLAIEYFIENANEFLKIENDMGIHRPCSANNGLWLSNINKFI